MCARSAPSPATQKPPVSVKIVPPIRALWGVFGRFALIAIVAKRALRFLWFKSGKKGRAQGCLSASKERNLEAQAAGVNHGGKTLPSLPLESKSSMKESTVSKVASPRVTRKSSSNLDGAAGGADEIGRAILTLSGGASFGLGKPDADQMADWRTFHSSGMAGRAARGIWFYRGIVSSDTSVLDAASASALAIWQAHTSGVRGDQLAGVGRRAAFVSLTRDACGGRTGHKAGSDGVTSYTLPLDGEGRAMAAVALAQWANTCQINETSARYGEAADADADADAGAVRRSRSAVESALARVKAAIWSDARGRKGFADRARFKFIAAVINGAEYAQAAKLANYANPKSALESLRSGKVWERLGIPAPRGLRAGFLQ